MREVAKAVLGGAISALNPQCRFDRALFVMAHMRCGSTAFSNILCSRPEISGYGEAHIAYRGAADLGRLVVNQALRRAWDPQARHLFDKLLHTRHDVAAPQDFFRARAIFLCRRPAPTIASIRRLFIEVGKVEYATDTAAAEYYVERVNRLAELWPRFPADRRVGLTHEALTAEIDACLARVSTLLNLEPGLENRYRSHAASIRGGGGDPTTSAHLTQIVSHGRPDGEPVVLDIDPTLLRLAEEAYSRFAALIGRDAPAARGGAIDVTAAS